MVEDISALPPMDDDVDDEACGGGGGGGGGGGDVPSESALRDNISRKGKNAYYYAHAHRATGPEVSGRCNILRTRWGRSIVLPVS